MLLKLTTIAAAFLIWAPVAQAWTWPVQGPVLQPFGFDPAHPYAAGQHRGIDIGAGGSGDPVVAPESGTVSFAGSVPGSGKSVTVETADGYTVTLTHLGSIAVPKGAAIAEGAVVGTVGPSGTAEQAAPYVHLGIRTTSDANGYLDPLGLLPAPAAPSQGSTAGSPVTAGAPAGSSSAPAPTPAPAPVSAPAPAAVPAAATATVSSAARGAGLVVRGRPAVPEAAAPRETATPPRATMARHRHRHRRDAEQPAASPVAEPRTLRRPLEEPSRGQPGAPGEATPAPVLRQLALGAGPGLAAAVAALATALVRLRRRARPAAAVVRFPGGQQLRRAA